MSTKTERCDCHPGATHSKARCPVGFTERAAETMDSAHVCDERCDAMSGHHTEWTRETAATPGPEILYVCGCAAFATRMVYCDLHAAAPAMREALEALLKLPRPCEPSFVPEMADERMREIVNAVLAQARGEKDGGR